MSLRGGDAVTEGYIHASYDWCMNLGAPATLIAGAVVATLYDNVRQGQLIVHKEDSCVVQWTKKATIMLLLSAFVLQIISIFVTTVSGTMLLSIDPTTIAIAETIRSPLAFFRDQFEFEYLTSRLSFLQGLLNWLSAVALEYTIPRRDEETGAMLRDTINPSMDKFVALSLGTVVVLLLSFYNAHMTFYPNYTHMILRWFQVAAKRFFGTFKPLMLIYIPGLLGSLYLGFHTLSADIKEQDNKAKSKAEYRSTSRSGVI
eukprot:Nitzschia sp. Nitz4//scaffold55_size114948//34602//35378//NITZ4_003892-RA/size114948-processed-gene-0.37-mRNA-1//1//CDS//3329554503//1660//frame0